MIIPYKRLLIAPSMVLFLVYCLTFQAACGASTPTKLKTTLLKIAEAENTAAKTNHALYESGVYGAVGSPSAIKIQQKVATGIYDSNEVLIVAIDVAKTITPSTFPQSKAQILSLLSQAASAIAAAHIGNPKIDLALQVIATLISDAVIFTTGLTSAAARHIKEAMPALIQIQTKLCEVNV